VIREPKSRVWPMAVALTAMLVAGGLVGYLIGRPTQSPARSRVQRATASRVPDLSGLRLSAAHRVLDPLGLETTTLHTTRSPDQPRGLVLSQDPAPGAPIRPQRRMTLTVSSGPGPAAGPTYVFARSVLIPIERSGPFSWTSTTVALDGAPVSLGANTRAIGAETGPYRISSAPVRSGTAIRVRFNVRRFHAPAWFVILKAFGRQRETGVGGPSLSVRPRSGPTGSVLSVEGHRCGPRREQTSSVVWRAAGRRERLPFRVSSFAFRVRFRVPAGLPPGTRVLIDAGERCRETFDVTG
jgi:PASTA domain-containing protein